MAILLTIGGNAMPTPSDYLVLIADISKAQRNAQGNMMIERINTKRTVQVTWAYLDQSPCSSLLQAVSAVSFSVTYFDPQQGGYLTKTMYCGDRNIGMIDFQNGVPRYKDVKFTLIEL